MTPPVRLAVTLVLLALWLGAALLTVVTVAPAAFDVLPPPLAGDLVARVLRTVFVSGLLISVFIAGLTPAGARGRYALAAVMVIACAAAHFVINPRIAVLRGDPSLVRIEMGGPQSPAFGVLHALSVGALGIAMAAALVLVILSLRDLRRTPESDNG